MSVTYEWIAGTTLGSSQTSVEFGSGGVGGAIPSTYTDLVLIMITKNDGTATAANGFLRLNGDTNANYSGINILGVTPNYAQTSGFSNFTLSTWAFDDTTWTTTTFNFFNYANTNVNKTFVIQQDMGNYGTLRGFRRWSQTNAINKITLTASDNTGSGTPDKFIAGSTFNLYGILAA